MSLLRRAFLAILAVMLAACSTVSVVADTRSSSAAAADVATMRLAPGDDLRLKLASGERVQLHLVAIEPDALVGTASKEGTPLRVPTGQIETIEREEFDGPKTALLVAAIVVLVYLVVKSLMEQSLDLSVSRVD